MKELNLSISFLVTEPSGYGLYGLFKNFFFKMQFISSRQQRAVKRQIFILQLTSAMIICFWVSIDVKTFQVLKNITKRIINEEEQDRTKIKVGEFIGFVDVCDRGWKIFLAVIKNLNLHISNLYSCNPTEQLWAVWANRRSFFFCLYMSFKHIPSRPKTTQRLVGATRFPFRCIILVVWGVVEC